MTATPTRIGFVIEQWRRTIVEDAGVAARHGSLARESDDPVETWFDSVDDAETMADERMALLATERRLFDVAAAGLELGLGLDYTARTPNGRLVDSEALADRTVLVSQITLDFDKQQTQLTVWG